MLYSIIIRKEKFPDFLFTYARNAEPELQKEETFALLSLRAIFKCKKRKHLHIYFPPPGVTRYILQNSI
jgi:hypothetical protein